MSEFTAALNGMQQKAVMQTEGPLLILAGAGSGKTTVLVNRTAHILKDLSVAPYRVLAVTFTNKAANEMKTRIENLFGCEIPDMWISTFHSMCVKILRRYIVRIGYDSNFAIYDTGDSVTLMKECIKELGVDEKQFAPKAVLGEIGRAKDEMIDPKAFLKINSGDFRLEKIGRLYELYQKKLMANNALDFDDIIYKTVLLFDSNEDVLQFYQKKFMYIMVDEYQDTNNLQYRLVSQLAAFHRNLCVVGDDDQSIYKFRGANIRNILDFEKEFPDAQVIKLEQNYRSTKNILNAANAVISNNRGRKAKKLWTDGDTGESIYISNCDNEHEEARYICREIDRKVSEDNFNFSDFALLYRTNAQSRVLEDALLRAGIPYRVLAGLRFYDRKEIKDILAYLRLIYNPADSVSLKRVINEPKRGIGLTTVSRAEAIAAEKGVSLYEVFSKADIYPELIRSSAKILEFVRMLEGFKEASDTDDLCGFVESVIDKTGYKKALAAENSIEAQSRIENIDELLSVVKEYVSSSESPSFGDFLESVALVSDIDNYDEDQSAVVLMTIHSAKGLEFPTVFITGLDEGIFPGMAASLSDEELEEERRLCYVAITRAKKELYMTHCASRMLYGTTKFYARSRFLQEIPEELTVEFGRKTKSTYSGGYEADFTAPRAEKKVNISENKVREYIKNNKSTLFEKFDVRAASNKEEVQTDFAVGDRVSHKKFGNGTVIAVAELGRDRKLTIDFDGAGTKNMMAMFANLKKI